MRPNPASGLFKAPGFATPIRDDRCSTTSDAEPGADFVFASWACDFVSHFRLRVAFLSCNVSTSFWGMPLANVNSAVFARLSCIGLFPCPAGRLIRFHVKRKLGSQISKTACANRWSFLVFSYRFVACLCFPCFPCRNRHLQLSKATYVTRPGLFDFILWSRGRRRLRYETAARTPIHGYAVDAPMGLPSVLLFCLGPRRG